VSDQAFLAFGLMRHSAEASEISVRRTASHGVITAPRIWLYGLILCAFNLSAVVYLSPARALWAAPSEPAPVSDFFSMWAAARAALHGNAAEAYQADYIRQLLASAISYTRGAFEFNYPPFFLFVLTPFATFSYPEATLIWLALTLSLYLATVYAIVRRATALVAALAAPTVLWELVTVQNGFLSAALIGAALLALERRPMLGGMLIGLLAYKPHLGLLFPVILIVSRYWRAFAAAAATVAVLAFASAVVFGTAAWWGFLDALRDTGSSYLVRTPNGWAVFQSVYGLSRSVGLGAGPAWVLHGVAAAAVVLAVGRLWMRSERYALKAAAGVFGLLAVTPYLYGYDLVILGIGVAFLVRDALATEFLYGEKAAILAVFGASVLVINLHQPVPIGPFILALLAWIVIRRSRTLSARDRSGGAA
jgi:hypothetical protein